MVDIDHRLRIDKWLWHARFFKSRTLAAKSVAAGRFRVNSLLVRKANQLVRSGDVLTFPLGPHIRVIQIVALGERRGPAVEARTLYIDLDPPQLGPAAAASGELVPQRERGAGRPTKKERRAFDRIRDERL